MVAIVRYPLYVGALVALLLAPGVLGSASAQQRVGVNSAVNPEATGIFPGAAPRPLVLGGQVVLNERIATGSIGQTQILFIDGSSMSLGPNAFMVIDRFRYDPDLGGGTLVTSMTRGVFRFIGGNLSKQDNAVTMQTPSATIGIHGGVVLVNLTPDRQLQVIFEYGNSITVTCSNGVSRTITRPGFEVRVAASCTAPSEPSPVPLGTTAALLAELDGRAGGYGGAFTVPTDLMVANSGLAAAVSSNVLLELQPEIQCALQASDEQRGCRRRLPNVANAVQQATTTIQATPVIVSPIQSPGSDVELGPKDVAAILREK